MVSFLMAILIAEVFLQVIGVTGKLAVDDTVVTVVDEKLGMRLLPNNDGIDARGYNNQVAIETADIVALGDSHTYGGHTSRDRQDISWPFQIAVLTDRSVYNMGVWGYGTAQYRALFDTAVSLKPKSIVIGMYTANDLFDTYDTVYHRIGWEEYQDKNFVDNNPVSISDTKQIEVPFRALRDWIGDVSVVYRLVGNHSRQLREYIGISKPVITGTSDWSNNDKDVSLQFTDENHSTLFWVGHRLPGVNLEDERIQEGWRISKLLYSEMAKIAKDNNIELVIILIPSKMTAYRTLAEEKMLYNDRFNQIVTNETLIRLNMLAYCKELMITCVDVALPLTEAIATGEIVYPSDRDEHPLPRGYEIYAQVAVDSLK
jgi:hypothetical protein